MSYNPPPPNYNPDSSQPPYYNPDPSQPPNYVPNPPQTPYYNYGNYGQYPPPGAYAPPVPSPTKERKPGPALANLCFLVATIAFLGLSVVAELGKWGFALTSIAGELSLVVVAVLFCVIGRFNFKDTFSLRKLDWGTVGFCVLAGLAGQFAVRFPATLNQWIMEIFGPFPTEDLIPNPKDAAGRILLFVVVVISAPICEETLNRGFVLAGYRRLSFGKAIFFVGLLFGLFHLYPFRFAYTFLLGMALAYVVLTTGSIFSSIAIHFGFNLIGGFSPWILEWLEKVNRSNGQGLIDSDAKIDLATVVATIPVSLSAAGLFFILLRVITLRSAKKRPELELSYFGFVRRIRAEVSSEAATEMTGPYVGPDRRFRYGRYGYHRTEWTADSSTPPGYPNPVQSWDTPGPSKPALSIMSRTWWQLSFIGIVLFYMLTTASEISIRLQSTDKAKLKPKTALVITEQELGTGGFTPKGGEAAIYDWGLRTSALIPATPDPRPLSP